jgi:hypothetical protein
MLQNPLDSAAPLRGRYLPLRCRLRRPCSRPRLDDARGFPRRRVVLLCHTPLEVRGGRRRGEPRTGCVTAERAPCGRALRRAGLRHDGARAAQMAGGAANRPRRSGAGSRGQAAPWRRRPPSCARGRLRPFNHGQRGGRAIACCEWSAGNNSYPCSVRLTLEAVAGVVSLGQKLQAACRKSTSSGTSRYPQRKALHAQQQPAAMSALSTRGLHTPRVPTVRQNIAPSLSLLQTPHQRSGHFVEKRTTLANVKIHIAYRRRYNAASTSCVPEQSARTCSYTTKVNVLSLSKSYLTV